MADQVACHYVQGAVLPPPFNVPLCEEGRPAAGRQVTRPAMSAPRGGRRSIPSHNTRPSRRSSASPATRSKPSPAGVKVGGSGGTRHDESCGSSPSVSPGGSAAGRRSTATPGSPQKTRCPQKTVKAPSSPSPELGTKGVLKNSVNRTSPSTPPSRPRPSLSRQSHDESTRHTHPSDPHEANRSSQQRASGRLQQKRRVLQHQGSSSDLSKSRGGSPDGHTLTAHHRGEKETSSDQSRSSTPDFMLQQQPRRPIVKQSSSSDDDKFDILWRLRSEEGRKESPLACTTRQDKAEPHTAPVCAPPRLVGAGRQYSLDSVLSPEKPQLSLKSMLSLCRSNGGAGGRRGAKLKRQDVCVEETEEETSWSGGAGSWPSLTVTHSSPVGPAPSILSPSTTCNKLQVKSSSLDRDKDSDWETQLLQVLDANAASANSSPATTPDGRRPSLLRRLKSLSRVGRQKTVNDDYGKGKCCRQSEGRESLVFTSDRGGAPWESLVLKCSVG